MDDALAVMNARSIARYERNKRDRPEVAAIIDSLCDRIEALTPIVSGEELVERLGKHSYKLPDGYYNDSDYGCNESCPESLIMATLDHGPLGTEVMQTLTAYGYTIVETEAVQAAAARIQQDAVRIERLTEKLKAIRTGCNFGVNSPSEALAYVDGLADEALASIDVERS